MASISGKHQRVCRTHSGVGGRHQQQHGKSSQCRLDPHLEMGSVEDDETEDMELNRLLIPLPHDQPRAHGQARAFLMHTLRKNSGLSQGEVGGEIRSWLWTRRSHRH
eukprot:927911-Pyramimonas_sp.AAC.1